MSEDQNDYTDGRLKKELSVSRQSRQTEDRRTTHDREISEDERLEMFRMQLYNDALPNIPDIPGYHVCWLTTTNKGDTIQHRTRLGYELVRAGDVPGMELITLKTGEYAGCVAVNEMIAAKLPLTLYHRYMQEAHHDAPMREESKMADASAQAGGLPVEDNEGGAYVKPPARGIFA